MTRLLHTAVLLCVVLTLAVALASCGKKRPPTPPDGATYPRVYPKPQ